MEPPSDWQIGGRLDPFWRCERVAPRFLEVGQGQGEGIRRVSVRDGRQVEHPLDHFCDGRFLSSAKTDDCLFYFPWGYLKDRHSGFCNRRERGTPGLAHDEGRLDILGEKETFDRTDPSPILTGHIPERLQDVEQTSGSFPTGRAPNGAKREGLMLRAPESDDTPTGAA